MKGKLDYYYPETIRGTIEALANIFSDIIVYKYDKTNSKIELINVPLQFGSQQAESKVNDNGEVESYTPQLPRIELIWGGLSLAPDRVISPMNDRYWNEENIIFEDPDVDPNEFLTQINGLFKDKNPIPYDYAFTVRIISDSLSYTSQILENTLPYFTPKNTGIIRVKEFAFLNVERDLVVEMGGISVDMPDELSFEDNRIITSEFDLVVEGFIYNKIRASKLVNKITTKIFTEYEIG